MEHKINGKIDKTNYFNKKKKISHTLPQITTRKKQKERITHKKTVLNQKDQTILRPFPEFSAKKDLKIEISRHRTHIKTKPQRTKIFSA
ncbi:hypothetical protein [Porphyromonas macacae]|uniref:hypothetical protein n=1 Tax=Porphyromonas macacae TaxID=28115 RepID=UPI00036067BE|nr:hypothetical protein [Porphyromonas macacae]